MYTKQLTKKRKTYSDGLLKISISSGVYNCFLIDSESLRQNVLESRQLEAAEVAKLKSNEEFEIELENYLVTIMERKETNNDSQCMLPLKLPKFVPPSKYIPPSMRDSKQGNKIDNVVVNSSTSFCSGQYKVTSDELDDIWEKHADVTLPSDNNFNKNKTATSKLENFNAAEHIKAELQNATFSSFNQKSISNKYGHVNEYYNEYPTSSNGVDYSFQNSVSKFNEPFTHNTEEKRTRNDAPAIVENICDSSIWD